MKGYNQGDMKPEVKNYQAPKSAYSQMYDQAPLRYVERNDRELSKAASKIKSQEYKGRYN